MTARMVVNQGGRKPARRPLIADTLGQQMREAREAAGLTQKAVARRIFVGASTVRCWEGGRRIPSVIMLDAYLRVVGATLTLGGQA